MQMVEGCGVDTPAYCRFDREYTSSLYTHRNTATHSYGASGMSTLRTALKLRILGRWTRIVRLQDICTYKIVPSVYLHYYVILPN